MKESSKSHVLSINKTQLWSGSDTTSSKVLFRQFTLKSLECCESRVLKKDLKSQLCRSSYTGSSSSDSEDEEDEELRAIRDAQRAKELRRKFEVWENSQDAKDQLAQMEAYDENGERLETAGILRRKFEALRMREEQASKTPPPVKAQFRPKRFKVKNNIKIKKIKNAKIEKKIFPSKYQRCDFFFFFNHIFFFFYNFFFLFLFQ